jgi:peptide-methionine (S)-S-oxide reductase
VVRTRVGYAGGQKANPTYYSLGDHTESLQVDFDPAQISYAELLEVFWSTHNPCAGGNSRQYMIAIFYHNESQRQVAEASRQREAARREKPVRTSILPLTAFYLAEDYHQKYMLRSRSALMRELKAMYPDEQDLVNSTVAARVNGYLGGHGTASLLEEEIDRFGLSAEGCDMLRSSLRPRH